MTKQEFAARAMDMQQTLYRVSATLLRRECDREDAVQEALVTALAKLPSLRKEEAFRAWLIRILINACHDILRRSSREVYPETMPEPAQPDEPIGLLALFHRLDETYRLPMTLHYIEGWDLRETARILHRPLGTVKSQLMRGRRQLKELMEQEGK